MFEAQHVYNVSWGKIYASRTTKSGMNLRKTLMVSGVLIKAKTAMISHSFSEYRDPSTSQPPQQPEAVQPPPAIPKDAEPQPSEPTQSCSDASVTDSCKDCTVNSAKDCSDSVSTQQTESQGADKENSHALTPISQHSDSDAENCSESTKSKGVLTQSNEINRKRPLDVAEESCESPLKKRCSESETTALPAPEPMDCAHISSLVARFDTGFTGLLADCENSSDDSSDSIVYSNLTSVSYSSGLSEGFSSCSTQIKESFDALSSTPIFLAV